MSEIDNLITWAQHLVAAAPKVKELEGLENRIAELKKNIAGMESTYRGLQASILEQNDKHSAIMADAHDKSLEIIDEAKKEAGSIIANAQAKASSIISSADMHVKQLEDGIANKAKEHQDLLEKTAEAQSTYDKIRNLLKAVP